MLNILTCLICGYTVGILRKHAFQADVKISLLLKCFNLTVRAIKVFGATFHSHIFVFTTIPEQVLFFACKCELQLFFKVRGVRAYSTLVSVCLYLFLRAQRRRAHKLRLCFDSMLHAAAVNLLMYYTFLFKVLWRVSFLPFSLGTSLKLLNIPYEQDFPYFTSFFFCNTTWIFKKYDLNPCFFEGIIPQDQFLSQRKAIGVFFRSENYY